jgi:hypothetical protein
MRLTTVAGFSFVFAISSYDLPNVSSTSATLFFVHAEFSVPICGNRVNDQEQMCPVFSSTSKVLKALQEHSPEAVFSSFFR